MGKGEIGIDGFGVSYLLVAGVGLRRDDVERVAVKAAFIIADSMIDMFNYGSVRGQGKLPKLIVQDFGEKPFTVFSARHPEEIPWGGTAVEFIVESTGDKEKTAGLFKTDMFNYNSVRGQWKRPKLTVQDFGEKPFTVFGTRHPEEIPWGGTAVEFIVESMGDKDKTVGLFKTDMFNYDSVRGQWKRPKLTVQDFGEKPFTVFGTRHPEEIPWGGTAVEFIVESMGDKDKTVGLFKTDMFNYDSVRGQWKRPKLTVQDFGEKPFTVFGTRHPEEIPWGGTAVEFIVESTGDKEKTAGLFKTDMFNYNSVRGQWKRPKLIVQDFGEKPFTVFGTRNPEEIPWGGTAAEFIVESTGDKDKAAALLKLVLLA